MKDNVQVYVWKPEYYRYLYDRLLEETVKRSRFDTDFGLSDGAIEKWKRDVLLMLLAKSEEHFSYNSKKLRRQIRKDLEEKMGQTSEE